MSEPVTTPMPAVPPIPTPEVVPDEAPPPDPKVFLKAIIDRLEELLVLLRQSL